jgi:ATP-dependent Clp protease ATP-binding subunit ClpC
LNQNRETLRAEKYLTRELAGALDRAASLMRRKKQPVMTAEILLLAFITTPEVNAHQLLRDFSRERGFDWKILERDANQTASDRHVVKDEEIDFVTSDGQRVPLGEELIIVLDEGVRAAQMLGEAKCSSIHALAVMANIRIGTHWLLNRRGVTREAVINELNSTGLAAGPVSPTKSTKQAYIYDRVDLQNKLLNLLSMKSERNLILVGPAGVGKRSLVISLRQLIARGKGPPAVRSVEELDERALLDNPQQAMQSAISRARGGILFVPDVDRFFGGIRAELGGDEGGTDLRKVFFADDLVLIGTATEQNFSKKLSNVRAIVEQSRVVRVPPATVEETGEILRALRPKFESDYQLNIVDDSLDEAARLAGRYYTDEPLPAAAVHLLHRACAMFLVELEQEAGQAVARDGRLDVDDVMQAASLLTGIPIANLGADERKRYLNMAQELHQRIIGQEEAVQALSRAVKMARVGLKDPKRPIGSFLFLGPTGVGKTELAKALAEFMFGTENALFALDMSEFMDSSSVNRLIGSPPGYIGHEAGGQLTDAVKKRPYSVILFDEVEKADLKVFDTLLQVMDEGRLTSGQGETVSFSECVILMTSNIGSRFLADPNMAEAVAQNEAEEAVKAHFRPEFLNRLDDIIFFHLLTQENLHDILGLLLGKEEKLMAGRDMNLQVSEAAKTWLLAQNEHPEWGARPLRRIIQKHVREPMADFLLEEDPPPGTTVKIQKKGKKLNFVQERHA